MRAFIAERSLTQRKSGRDGSALLLSTLFLVVLIPMLGLAIDGTHVYMMATRSLTLWTSRAGGQPFA